MTTLRHGPQGLKFFSRVGRAPDARAILLLTLIWLLFFSRLVLPGGSWRLSFVSGDFSAQNYAFSVYQFERFREGEIALWNPYNYGGSPFLADVQASVLYPPRLISLSLAALLLGEWPYETLQTETLLHTLLTSWLAYAFFRRLTWGQRASRRAALAGALVWAFGGYLSGYPQLQANILAAACWLPLQLLTLLEATRVPRHLDSRWLAGSGLAFTLSVLAGHPQTTFYCAYLWLAFFIYRCWHARIHWRRASGALLLMAIFVFAWSAVILLPAAEYQLASSRTTLTYADKANGFQLRDGLQFVLPGALSHWSPLYFGAIGFTLALYAIGRRVSGSLFWAGTALFALLLSLGGHGFLYPLLYPILPGLSLFRQQERAAILVAFAAAALVTLALTDFHESSRGRPSARGLLILSLILAILLVWAAVESGATRSALLSAVWFLAVFFAFHWQERAPAPVTNLLLVLIVLELFLFHRQNPNHSPLPAEAQLPGLVGAIRHAAQETGYSEPARVDGVVGLGGNYGAAYSLADIRGISPLALRGPKAIIDLDDSINPIAWELFAVSHVFHDWRELPLPTETSRIIAAQEGFVYVHRLAQPRPFAQFVPRYTAVPSAEAALAAITNIAASELREWAILESAPAHLPASNAAALYASAEVVHVSPERMELRLATPADALLSLALPYDGNWQARIDGAASPLHRAYGALIAIVIPGGSRSLILTYAPRSVAIGAFISGLAWLGLLGISAYALKRR
ncbi:MAG: YfhO family protein [Anaerolineaceae bacterium]|nr:YfhO family protein [Anaerolineaceae bacterium]